MKNPGLWMYQQMAGRVGLAYGLTAIVLVCGIWLLVHFFERRRAYKLRQQGRKKELNL